MDRIVLASRNRKKVAELQALLEPLRLTVVPVDVLPGVPEVEETGLTFEENAALKAETVAAATHLPTLADDSGLTVEALGGAPGVRSARFAGDDADDAANNRLLLERLQSVPDEQRAAAFVCTIAFAVPGQPTRFFQGRATGRILHEPRGASGFGYDPLFLSDDLGATFAEADSAAKNRVSHRGRALEQFVAWLSSHRTGS